MSTQISGSVRTGTCPHGLPPGACPVCSGAGGGGASRVTEHKPGELTWSQCYAIGQMMKAQKLAKEEAQTEALLQAQKTLISVTNNIIMPAIRFVQTVFSGLNTTVSNLINTVKEKIAEITDKLTAVFGELKAAVEKKISDKLRELKKKLFNLFGIAEADNEEEEKRVEEEKRLFDLKNLKEILFNPERHRDESQENEQKDGEK